VWNVAFNRLSLSFTTTERPAPAVTRTETVYVTENGTRVRRVVTVDASGRRYYIEGEEENRRHRVTEDGLHELIKWIRQRGSTIAVPIKEGLEAIKSAVEEVSQSGARIGRHFPSLFGKQKCSFLNLF
jgi:hypothetical protein